MNNWDPLIQSFKIFSRHARNTATGKPVTVTALTWNQGEKSINQINTETNL